MSQETWRPIPGYSGIYEASDLGHIQSLDRIDMRGTQRKGRVLRSAVLQNGRSQVTLYLAGVPQQFRVHRLVALAFHGEPRADQVACHNDGDLTNNRATNIRWDTASENQRDAVKHGTHREARKTHCPRGHSLTVPNLVASHLRRGQRQCRACARAYSAARRDAAIDIRAYADEQYARLMPSAGRE